MAVGLGYQVDKITEWRDPTVTLAMDIIQHTMHYTGYGMVKYKLGGEHGLDALFNNDFKAVV